MTTSTVRVCDPSRSGGQHPVMRLTQRGPATSGACLVSAHPKYLASSKAKSRHPQSGKMDVPGVRRLVTLISDPAEEELCNVLSSRTLLQIVRQGVHRLSVVIRNGAIWTIITDLRKTASTRRVSVRLGEMLCVPREPTTHTRSLTGQREDGNVRCGTGPLQRRQRVTAGDVDTLAHGTSSVTSSVLRSDALRAGRPPRQFPSGFLVVAPPTRTRSN